MHPTNAEIAKDKLAGPTLRTVDLEFLEAALEEGEQVATMADALFRSAGGERRGLAVLTDRRLLCVDKAIPTAERLTIDLSGVTSVDVSSSGGAGDAKRGDLVIISAGTTTRVGRIHPWERAEEMATLIRSRAKRSRAA